MKKCLIKKKKAGTFTKKDVLEGRLYKAHMEILWFLALATIATPEILSIATGYTLKSIQVFLRQLANQFKLVKRIATVSDKKETKRFYALTQRGYEKLGIKEKEYRSPGYKREVFLEHKFLVVKLLAYFFRNDIFRIKGEEEQAVRSEENWRYLVNTYKEILEMQAVETYGNQEQILRSEIKRIEKRVRDIPAPDFYFKLSKRWIKLWRFFGEPEKQKMVFVEVETGKDKRKTHLNEKLRRYWEHRFTINSFFFEGVEKIDVDKYILLFVSPNDRKKESLQRRVEKLPWRPMFAFQVAYLTLEELEKLLPYCDRDCVIFDENGYWHCGTKEDAKYKRCKKL